MRTTLSLAVLALFSLAGCSKPDPATLPTTTATATGTGSGTGGTSTTDTGTWSGTGTGTGSGTGSGTGTGTGAGTGSGTGTGTGAGTGTGTGGSTPACNDDLNEPNEDIPGALPAILNDPTLAVTDLSDDYWAFDIPAGQQLDIDLTFIDAWGDVDIELFTAAGNMLDDSVGVADYEHVATANPTQATITVYLRVWLFGAGIGDCNTYEMASALTPYAGTCTDDIHEPNDSIASALPIVTNDPSLVVTSFSDDFWSFDVPAYTVTTVDLLFIDADGDVDVELTDAAGTYIDGQYSTSDNETVGVVNDTATPQTYYLQVYHYDAYLGDCNSYELQVTDDAIPSCAEDANEPNDTVATALPIVLNDPALAVTDTNRSDYWSFDVPDGTTTTLDVSFLDAVGDIDLTLTTAAGTYVVGSTTGANVESVEVSNASGAVASYVLEVELDSGTCNPYAITRTDVP